ncbi:hypothetical protein [Motilibacter aurantiacus]|uniref:hypothetical protein n=1 Tax=Motilibacter aurantiacus TaxID=2714955 RepID=UPI00140E095E|nr:hypothetical protein [Motilibacter aurantiacus]NHC47551.1 hypothetical protein [Motilibacter aurantiacus]
MTDETTPQAGEHGGDRYGEQALDRGIPAASGSGRTLDPSAEVPGTAEGHPISDVSLDPAHGVPAEATDAGTPAASDVDSRPGG